MQHQWLIENESGKWLILNRKDAVSWNLLKDGYFEPAPGLLVKELLPVDATVIDVGANLGTFAVAAGKHITKGRLYAYEAQRLVCYQLAANVLLNKLANVYINNWGIGNPETGGEAINVPLIDISSDHNCGAVSLLPNVMNNYNESNFVFNRPKVDKFESIPYVSLDMVHGDDKVDFIKIDVEGMEFQVLEGAKGVISNCMPVIFFESNDLGNAAKWFKDFDYDLVPVGRDTLAFPRCGIRSGKRVVMVNGYPQII